MNSNQIENKKNVETKKIKMTSFDVLKNNFFWQNRI